MLVIAPSPRWISEIFHETGDAIKNGGVLIRFDAYDLERQIARLRSKLELNAVSAERLTDDYIKKYVYTPLDELIEVRRKEYFCSRVFMHSQMDLGKVGDILQSGVINHERDGTVALARKDMQDAKYAFDEAREEKLKKASEVKEERVKNLSEMEEISNSITLLSELVSRRTIRSPADGIVTYACVVGQFVDKGDVVAEIV